MGLLTFEQLREHGKRLKHGDRDPMDEDQAQGVSGHQLMGTRMDAVQGDAAGAVEKGADFDGGGFLGDGTRIMPQLRQIWKTGHVVKRAAYSTFGVEDMDATYQSRLNPSVKDERATDAGTREPSLARNTDVPIDVAHRGADNLGSPNPGSTLQTTSDVGVSGAGVGTGEMSDNPITEVEEPGPQAERIRIAKGLQKRAALAVSWVNAMTNPHILKLAQALRKSAYVLDGKTEFQGLPIALEHTAGGVRRGVDKDGHAWETVFRYAYGYIEGTKGADGEGVDVFLGPNINADTAYVVHQKKPETGKYDEDKVMLGFDSEDEAKQAYLDHYDNPNFFESIHPVSMDALREMVAKKKTLVKIAALLQKKAYDVFDSSPEMLSDAPGSVHFKMPGKVKSSDAAGAPGVLGSAARAAIEPLEPLQPSNPISELKRDVSDVRRAKRLFLRILQNRPLI